MDEMHIASKINMSIHKIFKKIGLLNLNYLLTNDIKILEFTATPEGTIYDLCKWGIHSIKLNVEPGLNYIGAINLLNNRQVKQFKNLFYNKNSVDIIEIKKNIEELTYHIELYTEPKYHIIRTMNGNKHTTTVDNFINLTNNKYIYTFYDESTLDNINDIICDKPTTHTIIFIKEKLRCAKTLHKEHLGILYERYNIEPDDTVIIQGLLGRLTGYHYNDECIIFTNIPTIIKYEKLWNSNFNNKNEWKSKTTKTLNGKTISNKTFNGDIIGITNYTNELPERTPNIYKSKSQHDCIKFVKKYFKTAYGPKLLIPNKEGYFESIISSIKKVRSCDEILLCIKNGLTPNHYR